MPLAADALTVAIPSVGDADERERSRSSTKIYLIRGQKVMLDSNWRSSTETRALGQAEISQPIHDGRSRSSTAPDFARHSGEIPAQDFLDPRIGMTTF